MFKRLTDENAIMDRMNTFARSGIAAFKSEGSLVPLAKMVAFGATAVAAGVAVISVSGVAVVGMSVVGAPLALCGGFGFTRSGLDFLSNVTRVFKENFNQRMQHSVARPKAGLTSLRPGA